MRHSIRLYTHESKHALLNQQLYMSQIGLSQRVVYDWVTDREHKKLYIPRKKENKEMLLYFEGYNVFVQKKARKKELPRTTTTIHVYPPF